MNKSNWLTGTGIIKYDPYRHGMKRKTKWWMVLQVDREITRYYRWWVKKTHWVDLAQPSWDAHVSVIRGEQPDNQHLQLWKKYNNQKVTFEYRHYVTNVISSNGRPSNFWCVEVKCNTLTNMRRELNLPHDWNFHLTIGRTWK